METYDIQLSAFAEYNLLNIYCYIAESFSIETAKYTSQKIYKAIVEFIISTASISHSKCI